MISKKSKGLIPELSQESVVFDKDRLVSFIEHNMSQLSLQELVGMITNRYKEILEYIDLCNGLNTCQKTSLLFNPHRLETRSHSSKCSVYSALSHEKIKYSRGLARTMLSKRNRWTEVLYQSIAWSIEGVQYIGEFPPHKARDIAKHYKVNSKSSVLDPCAGWGGRMIGVSVVCDNYTAFEPSSLTFAGLKKLEAYLQSFSVDFSADLHMVPFENARLVKESFDFALTSPPYYNTELYSDEISNSLNRYKDFDEWCSGFYIPMIKKTMRYLKDGSVFILNIGSRKYPLNDVLFDVFSDRFQIRKQTKFTLGGKGGLGKKGEGETFYEIRKDNPKK